MGVEVGFRVRVRVGVRARVRARAGAGIAHGTHRLYVAVRAEGGEELLLVGAGRDVADVEVARGAMRDGVGEAVRERLGLAW